MTACAVPKPDPATRKELQEAAAAAEARAQARHAELVKSLSGLSKGNAAVQDAVKGLQDGSAKLVQLQELSRAEVGGRGGP